MLTFEPGKVEDARFIADVRTAEFPDAPTDPAEVALWYTAPQWRWLRFNIHETSRPVGFAIGSHFEWSEAPERFGEVEVGLLPDLRTAANLATGFEFVEDRLREDGARVAVAFLREDDSVALKVVAERGYREDRRERFWELDLVAGRDRLLAMAERSRGLMRERGVTITTVAADTDPDGLRKLHAMSAAAELDVPTTGTHVPDSLERMQEWLASPTIHRDRVWVARIGEEVVGLSALTWPVERGIVSTDWTCVARPHRNRGIARALKLETIAQAIGLGVDRVRTDNDFQNAPILHLNEDLGYRHVHDWLKLNRDL